MCSPTPERVQCALIVQRLMDADLLLADEGNALLTEIEAWDPPTDSAETQRTHAKRFAQALEAITQIDRLDASARQTALEAAHALIHQSTNSTTPPAQSGKLRD